MINTEGGKSSSGITVVDSVDSFSSGDPNIVTVSTIFFIITPHYNYNKFLIFLHKKITQQLVELFTCII